MKVRELIALLSKFEPDQEAWLEADTYFDEVFGIHSVYVQEEDDYAVVIHGPNTGASVSIDEETDRGE